MCSSDLWRLGETAWHMALAATSGRTHGEALRELRTCIDDALRGEPGEHRTILLLSAGLIDVRLGEPARALDGMRRVAIDLAKPEWWHSLYHFVRCRGLLATGDRAGAEQARAALTASAAATGDDFVADLLREAEAALR